MDGALGGAAALIISFVALGAFWNHPRLKGDASGHPIPSGLQRLLDSQVTRGTLRTTAVLATLATLLVALFGEGSSAFNPAPTWFYVWFWVGLVPASMLFGPTWKVMNPLRAVSRALHKFINGPGADGEVRPLPAGVGLWPAAASLLAFVWLELVFDEADRPLVVAAFLSIYCVVHTAAGVRYGFGWFSRGDGFEVYSTLIGRVAPLGRRTDGRIVWRSPLNGLAGLPRDQALVPVVAVILGSTAFDGLTRTQVWNQWSEKATDLAYAAYLGLGTLGLLASIGIVWLSYTWAANFSWQFSKGIRKARARTVCSSTR